MREDVQAFESHVYRFGLRKLWRRLNKPLTCTPAGKSAGNSISWSEFFCKHVSRLRQGGPDEVARNLKDIPQVLWHLYRAVKACRDGLSREDEEEQMLLVSLASKEIWQRVLKIFAIKGWQQGLRCKLGKEAKGKHHFTCPTSVSISSRYHQLTYIFPVLDFRFERFLQNLIVLPTATIRLLETAANRKFYLRYLDPRKTSVSITRLENETHTLHPELLLALHFIRLRRRQLDTTGPGPRTALSYIGTSRLPCLPCYTFVNCLREADILSSTRGTHGKKYAPWRVPKEQLVATGLAAEQREVVVKRFADRLAGIYTARMEESLKKGMLEGDEEWDGEDGVVD